MEKQRSKAILVSITIFLILLFTVVFLKIPASDQKIENFSLETEKFPLELQTYLKSQLSKEEENYLKEFTILWESDFLSPDQKQQIVTSSNNLLKKTITSTKHFVSLVRVVLHLQGNELAKNHFGLWLKGLENFSAKTNISIVWLSNFIDNSLSFFTTNVIRVNPAYQWKVSPSDYSLVFDTTLSFRFKNTNLICISDKDSIAILSTQGSYFPLQNQWYGKGGKVTWIRSQFPVDEIFAALSYYKIDLTKNDYQADSVLFTNKDYFPKPVLGKLKDKVLKSTRLENIYFPEFRTYTSRHKITNLFQGVDYDGGYYMMGGQLIGTGTRENPALIEVKRNKKDFLRIEALQYIFRRQTVISDFAKVRFRIDNDSIFHSGLGFSYNDATQTISLQPTDFITTKSPISSSYHKFSFTFNELTWNIKQDIINFGAPTGSSSSRSYFESNNFFNETEFDDLMGLDEQHPLLGIANYTRSIRSRTFDARGFARFMRKSEEQTRIMLMRTAMMGYIYYDAETGEAQANPKLFDAIRARGKQIDYDVIRFSSSSPDRNPNATINLSSLEMTVRGVENVSVSDSQNVFFYPNRRQITLKKNRNFAFDGVIRAGLLTLYGKDFNFDYSSFSFKLNSIDSLNIDFQTDQYDFYGRKVLNRVTSTMENITGEIYIDNPNNKSGLIKYKEYPIFKSTKESFVYYDDKSIHNGIYKRTNFYFEVYPFTFKSINSFSRAEMNFEGKLYSAEIFAPIQDTLILRPDNSLGIINVTPPEGIAIYQGKGRYYNRIDLSNKGLRGRGELTYITSRTTSDDLYFFPDSMGTISKEFNITRQDAGIQYPDLKGKQHIVKWQPYNDKLMVYRGDTPFDIFLGQSKLTGNLLLDPLGLTGNGLVDLTKARLRSKLFSFNAIDFKSDATSVELDVPGTERLAFSTDIARADVNFLSRKGEFSKVNKSIFAQLPGIQYESHLDLLTWEMDQNELTLKTPAPQRVDEIEKFYVPKMVDRDTIPSGSLFYSVKSLEDSIYFFAPKAKYSLSSPNLKADSVNYIIIADAIIHPYRKKIEIDAQKRIVPLKQSVIYANYTQRYHRIYNATITIPSRKAYIASGTINYVDERDSIQKVFLNEIKVDKGNTYAQTVLTEPDSFKLSPQFAYMGSIDLFANDKYWTFTGGVKPLHNCSQINSSWLKFKSTIDPQNIFIPISDKPLNLNLVNLLTGSIISTDSIHLYPSLVSGRKYFSDKPLIAAEGVLHYSHKNNRFLVGPQHKIANPDTTGNIIGLSKDFCLLFSEGTLNFPVNLGQVKNFASGSTIHKLADSTLSMDLAIAFDFHFNQNSLTAMASDIVATQYLGNVDLSSKTFDRYLQLRTDPKDAAIVRNQIKLFGSISQITKGLESTITFADVRFRWDQKNRSFVSVGKLGIGSVGNIQVNKKVDGFIEIIKRPSGDWMTIYIQPSSDKYYFFYYVRGSMQVGSHSPLFTDPIKQMKSRDRKVKVKLGQIPYNFTIASKREITKLQERYRAILGLSDQNQHVEEGEEQENDANGDGN
jgi:hypothetical protein